MSDIARRFRERAKECRRLATEARDAQERDTLTKMAVELDEEAELIDLQIERANSNK